MGSPKKIVILGSGCGSMAAAWGLSSQPDWQSKYSIDVYQLGWRCGGKGAAGRNRAMGDRIEEHGLHMWFGFYQNAFAMIREVYAELNRLGPYGFPTWREAFTPRNDLFLEEYPRPGRWERWHTTFPANEELPGNGHPYPSLDTLVREALEWGIELLFGADVLSWLEHHFEPFEPTPESTSAIERLARKAGFAIEEKLLGDAAPRSEKLTSHLAHARALTSTATNDGGDLAKLIDLLRAVLRWLVRAAEAALERDTDIRRVLILLDLGLTILVGLVADGCVSAWSLAPIDRYDWMEWLRKNGATQLCLRSPWVRGLYDGPFAYMRGDTSRPSLSAAVAVRGQLRGAIGYKGAPMWQMNAGMGDTIFAPLYLVLKARGVRFHFFHKARELALDTAGTSLESVRLGVQATTKQGEYVPTFPLGGIECWPSEPDYAQLEQGDELRARHVDLESSWTDWKDVGEKVLRRGTDFDVVVGGMSLAAWPIAAPALFEGTSPRAEKWRAIRDGLPQIVTQSAQLWIDPSAKELGWKSAPGFTGAYAQPFDTWADMSDLLAWERWPDPAPPRALVYLCGPMREPAVLPPFTDVGFPAREKQRVRDAAADWLSASAGYPFPGGAPDDEPASLDPAYLHDDSGVKGWARIDAQYCRANVEPTERYVLSPPGSSPLRFRAQETGVDGLLAAGDWLKTGLDSGCVEAAVIGGLQASQAICGGPPIVGADDETPKGGG